MHKDFLSAPYQRLSARNKRYVETTTVADLIWRTPWYVWLLRRLAERLRTRVQWLECGTGVQKAGDRTGGWWLVGELVEPGKQEAAEAQPQEQVAAQLKGTAATGELMSAAAWEVVSAVSMRTWEQGIAVVQEEQVSARLLTVPGAGVDWPPYTNLEQVSPMLLTGNLIGLLGSKEADKS